MQWLFFCIIPSMFNQVVHPMSLSTIKFTALLSCLYCSFPFIFHHWVPLTPPLWANSHYLFQIYCSWCPQPVSLETDSHIDLHESHIQCVHTLYKLCHNLHSLTDNFGSRSINIIKYYGLSIHYSSTGEKNSIKSTNDDKWDKSTMEIFEHWHPKVTDLIDLLINKWSPLPIIFFCCIKWIWVLSLVKQNSMQDIWFQTGLWSNRFL